MTQKDFTDKEIDKIRKYTLLKSKTLTHNINDAEDITQNVMLDIHKNLDKIINIRTLYRWIEIDVQRRTIDFYRKYYQKKEKLLDKVKVNNAYNSQLDNNIDTKLVFKVIENERILSATEITLLKDVFLKNIPAKKLEMKYDLTSKSLNNKIRNCCNEVILARNLTKINSQTNSIPGTKLHRNIMHLITNFCSGYKTKNFDKIVKQYKNCFISDSVGSLNITENKKIMFDILENDIIVVNCYFCEQKKIIDTLFIKIKLLSKNNFNVLNIWK